MQSVIAIIVIELMYLLGVLGKCWLGRKEGSLRLTETVSSIRPIYRAGRPSVQNWMSASLCCPLDLMDMMLFV